LAKPDHLEVEDVAGRDRMIVHVIDNLRPASGGPTTVVIQLAEQQAAVGKQVYVICREGPDVRSERESLERRWGRAGIGWTELHSISVGRRSRELENRLVELSPQVVHLHCVWESILHSAHAVCRRVDVPTVMSTHGMLHPFVLAQKWLKKSAYLALFGNVVRANKSVLALNNEESRYVEARFGVPATVLPNAVDVTSYLRPPSGVFRSTIPSLRGSPFILFVGRLHPIKGIDLLVKSFARAREQGVPHHLVIAGPDDGARTDLLALVERLGISQCVHLPGPVWGHMKLEAFADCDVFAHRPRFEGFGIAVAEAMASGKPVVTTRKCLLDGAADAGAVLESPDDDIGFAAALARVCRDPALRSTLGSSGRRWVSEQLSWHRVLKIADDAYSL
jgi:glycosyltransferase involved in cell wall biosynthesis